MGNKFSTGLSKVAQTISLGAQTIGGIANSALQGGLAGSIAGPEGTIAGALGGGLLDGLGNLSDVISKGKNIWEGRGENPSQSVANTISSIMSNGAQVKQAIVTAKNSLPPQSQAKVDNALNAAKNSAIGSKVLQTGKMASAATQGALQAAYQGKILPSEYEKFISPLRQAGNAMMSPQQVDQMDRSREVAYLDRIQPQQAPASSPV